MWFFSKTKFLNQNTKLVLFAILFDKALLEISIAFRYSSVSRILLKNYSKIAPRLGL